MIETDPLSLLFIGCFLLGFLFLLITAFSGHVTDGHGHGVAHHVGHNLHVHAAGTHAAHHAHPGAQDGPFSLLSFINPITIVLFLIGFGFFGYVFHNVTDLALPLAISLAGVSGLVIAALFLMLLSRLFGDSEGATVQDVSDRTGLLGKVSITIPENNLGEILYVSPGGMRKSVPARSTDGRRLEREQEVVVVNYQRGVAEVDTWDHFVNQEEVGLLDKSNTDELATLRALLEEPSKVDTEYVSRHDTPKE